MMRTKRFLGVGIFALLSLAAHGCRVGNHVEKATGEQDPNAGDPVSGYYTTQPQSLKVCVNHVTPAPNPSPDPSPSPGPSPSAIPIASDEAPVDGPSETRCVQTSLHEIPAEMATIFTNPVALILRNKTTGRADLVAPRGDGSYLPVFADLNTLKLSLMGNAPPTPFLGDPACTSQLYIEEDGRAIRDAKPGSSTVAGLPIYGRLEMTVRVNRLFDRPKCRELFAAIQTCYADMSYCGGSTVDENDSVHRQLQGFFGLYVESGAVSVEELGRLTAISYELDYR